MTSGDDLSNDFPRHIGQPEIATGVSIRQLFVIDPQLMQDRRMKVVDMNPIVDRTKTKIVGLTKRHSASDTASSHPDREAVVIVVSPVAIF